MAMSPITSIKTAPRRSLPYRCSLLLLQAFCFCFCFGCLNPFLLESDALLFSLSFYFSEPFFLQCLLSFLFLLFLPLSLPLLFKFSLSLLL